MAWPHSRALTGGWVQAEPGSGLHGLAAGGQHVPARADWTIDQDWDRYTDAEHAVWATLFDRQTRLVAGRASDAFVQGLAELPLAADRIPDFGQLSQVLHRRTGWQVVAVPGLVPDEVFFEHLAHRRFPAGHFIRKPHELDYLQEPDVFHDIFGHVPLLLNPVIADYMQAYGEGGLRARRLGSLAQLARVYWYTIEFGLVMQADGLRAFGAGILSSSTETEYALTSPRPNRIGFDLQRVMRTLYRIDDFQDTYFVLSRLDDLLALAQLDFEPLYARASRLPDLPPDHLSDDDRVISRGIPPPTCP